MARELSKHFLLAPYGIDVLLKNEKRLPNGSLFIDVANKVYIMLHVQAELVLERFA